MTGSKTEIQILVRVSCETCWNSPTSASRELDGDVEQDEGVYKCPKCGATVLVEFSIGN